MEAEITLKYDNSRLAAAVANAISPDNLRTPRGLSVRTALKASRVVTHIEYQGKLETFIATIDDLLFCASTAEKALQTARELE